MKKPTTKQVLWMVGGGMAGFAWYYFVGCATGTCPISSNPYISTAYGTLMGGLMGWNKPRQVQAGGDQKEGK
jgi:hypothetical protein